MDTLQILNPIMQLVNLDVKSLIGALIWGNLTTAFIILLYENTSRYKLNFRSIAYNMAFVRFLEAFGFLCLFLRDSIPDIISANVGNTILFPALFMEYRIIMEATSLYNRKMNSIGIVILSVSLIVFNTVELLFHDPALRIGMASGIIFLLSLPAAVMLLKNTDKFKKGVGIFYIPLILALIPRGIESFTGKLTSISANTYYQTIMFGSLILLMISNSIIYLLFIKEKKDGIIEKMAKFDGLTNLMNRNSFFPKGNDFFEKYKKNKRCLSVLFLDVDFFKAVNDNFGHQFGDDVLMKFAKTVKNNIRPSDICCRYGGEEFVILASANEKGCENMSDRILKETEKITFDSKPNFRMTTSIGCVVGIPALGETLDNFIAKADKALYKAKRDGRNRIVFYTEGM